MSLCNFLYFWSFLFKHLKYSYTIVFIKLLYQLVFLQWLLSLASDELLPCIFCNFHIYTNISWDLNLSNSVTLNRVVVFYNCFIFVSFRNAEILSWGFLDYTNNANLKCWFTFDSNLIQIFYFLLHLTLREKLPCHLPVLLS